jgi:dUTP pyrophosphatase
MIEVKLTHPELYPKGFRPAKQGDAGYDLRADKDYYIQAGDTVKITSGVYVNMGPGLMGLVLPRSGLSSKTGFHLANTAGVIDSGYQGEIICHMTLPLGQTSLHLKRGERFSQVVFLPVSVLEFKLVEEFSTATERGGSGFGSTGRG